MFDSVLGQGAVAKNRFGTGAVISVTAHAALLSLAVWLSTRPAIDKAPERAVTFFAAPASPPAPAKKGSSTPKVEKKVVKRPDVIVQPKKIPQDKPKEAEPERNPEPAEEDEPEGVEGGVEGGVAGGVIGGVVGGTGSAGGGHGATEVLPFGEGMTRPEQTEGRDPVYTREALEAHVEGLMLVKCVVTVEGRLENCRIIKSLPHMDQAVLEALATKRFKPLTYQGRPVAVDYVFPIRLVIPHR